MEYTGKKAKKGALWGLGIGSVLGGTIGGIGGAALGGPKGALLGAGVGAAGLGGIGSAYGSLMGWGLDEYALQHNLAENKLKLTEEWLKEVEAKATAKALKSIDSKVSERIDKLAAADSEEGEEKKSNIFKRTGKDYKSLGIKIGRDFTDKRKKITQLAKMIGRDFNKTIIHSGKSEPSKE